MNLIDYDSEAENKVIAAILYPYSSIPLQQIRDCVRNMSDSEKSKLIKQAAGLKGGHGASQTGPWFGVGFLYF
ncbi:MAG: hypothetical protein CM1200mP28_10110 [Deltaproteobacteria bacterium]|nr:MAG: hypothetical protein CM1200mP28_10110 [Deltaproteobacteria bacterium]